MKNAVLVFSMLVLMITAVTSCLPPPPGMGGGYGGRYQRNYHGNHGRGYDRGGHYGYSDRHSGGGYGYHY
jgi:uncharacterized membrane protein